MFNECPPAPRYHQVWDVSLVVRHFQTGQSTSELTLKELSKKLVTLLALCNASRASDIRALDMRFKQSTGEGVKSVIPGLTKARRSGPPREVLFRAFNEADSLCPVKTLDVYVEKTAQLRVRGSQLVISFKKPHNPVTSASISRWVKETLADAGVDTSMFKGHSIRAASTSAARAKGVSISDIFATAGWSRSSTFERFYHKQIANDFSQAILRS